MWLKSCINKHINTRMNRWNFIKINRKVSTSLCNHFANGYYYQLVFSKSITTLYLPFGTLIKYPEKNSWFWKFSPTINIDSDLEVMGKNWLYVLQKKILSLLNFITNKKVVHWSTVSENSFWNYQHTKKQVPHVPLNQVHQT